MKRIFSFILLVIMVFQLCISSDFSVVQAEAGKEQEESVIEVRLYVKPYQDGGITPLAEHGTGCTLEYIISMDGKDSVKISLPVRYTYGIKGADGKEYAKITDVGPCSVAEYAGTAYTIKKDDISTKYTTSPAVITTTCSVRNKSTGKVAVKYRITSTIKGNGDIATSKTKL